MIGIVFFYPVSVADEDRPTWPPAGTASLHIEQEQVPLFFSATWVIRARIDGDIFIESQGSDVELERGRVRQWARALIRKYYNDLRLQGVDADKLYLDWGGVPKDLS